MADYESLLEQYIAAPPNVSYTVGRLDKLVSQQLGEVLHPFDVTLPQFTMLANLHMRGATANADLAARSFITPQAANQIITIMQQHGWVEKRSDPNHGRILLIELTESGRELYERCAKAASEVERRMLAGLPPETVVVLKKGLRRLVKNLSGGQP